ncbi:hypothetical protein EDB80DRAFT_724492 [Ilyonectria destructans]|nr:hypothetical protein EDB80DRAFT_724492 [Ilyonectria destructans]
MPHRHFNLPTSTLDIFTNFYPIFTRFSVILLQSSMATYTKNEVDRALESIEKGQSIQTAARIWGVPRSTLQNPIRGCQPRDLAFTSQQRLSQT